MNIKIGKLICGIDVILDGNKCGLENDCPKYEKKGDMCCCHCDEALICEGIYLCKQVVPIGIIR